MGFPPLNKFLPVFNEMHEASSPFLGMGMWHFGGVLVVLVMAGVAGREDKLGLVPSCATQTPPWEETGFEGSQAEGEAKHLDPWNLLILPEGRVTPAFIPPFTE